MGVAGRLVTPFIAAAVFGYLLGSLPSGYLLIRWFRGEDVRDTGSGNIGATNVARSSRWLGVLTLILDAAKGFVAVFTAVLINEKAADCPMDTDLILLMYVAALSAVLGHMFPLWLKFRGGKGVATAFGAFFLIAPNALLAAACVFLLVVAVSRYVSLASVVAVAFYPALAWFLDVRVRAPLRMGIMVAVSLLIIARHHQNIRRLLGGTESRFHWKRA